VSCEVTDQMVNCGLLLVGVWGLYTRLALLAAASAPLQSKLVERGLSVMSDALKYFQLAKTFASSPFERGGDKDDARQALQNLAAQISQELRFLSVSSKPFEQAEAAWREAKLATADSYFDNDALSWDASDARRGYEDRSKAAEQKFMDSLLGALKAPSARP